MASTKTIELTAVNSETGLLVRRHGKAAGICAFRCGSGRITGIHWVANPDKLPASTEAPP